MTLFSCAVKGGLRAALFVWSGGCANGGHAGLAAIWSAIGIPAPEALAFGVLARYCNPLITLLSDDYIVAGEWLIHLSPIRQFEDEGAPGSVCHWLLWFRDSGPAATAVSPGLLS